MNRKKIGNLFVIGYQGLNPSDDFLRFVEEWGIGGVIVFARNLEDPENLPDVLKKIQEAAGKKIFTAIDQEGGLVMRILKGGSLFQSAMGLAATGDETLVEATYEAIAKEMLSLGLNWNLAPVLDINHPDNPGIGARSFGDQPEQVARFGCAAVRGLQKAGVLSCAKHFPGKGNARVDSHLTLPVIDNSVSHLEQNELYPFKKAIEEKVAAIMTAHVFFPAFEKSPDLPATLSKSVLTDLLRHQLNYEGLLITDDLEMGAITESFGIADAASRSFAAGADQLLICHSLEQQKAAAEKIYELATQNAAYGARLEESLQRIEKARSKLVKDCRKESLKELNSLHANLIETTHEKAVKFMKKDSQMQNLSQNEALLVMYPEISALVQVEEFHNQQGLEACIKKEFPAAICVQYHPKDSESEIMSKFEKMIKSGKPEKLVFFTYNSHLFPEQTLAANSLADKFSHSTAIALRNPYDLTKLSSFTATAAVFSFRTPAIIAALKTLKGELEVSSEGWPIKMQKN
ncbi:MAG: beta-N-acetylhexosaminidase [Clostridiales bacterium]|jgi:beta-N-acetylhexosaminidase|nr:beta-N-acetylhexosaminidase [Clostridiales bacterium]MDN5282885.1 beta-N-acetylhexosaminidase [Candidatus Ozemobacter sp.]